MCDRAESLVHLERILYTSLYDWLRELNELSDLVRRCALMLPRLVGHRFTSCAPNFHPHPVESAPLPTALLRLGPYPKGVFFFLGIIGIFAKRVVAISRPL